MRRLLGLLLLGLLGCSFDPAVTATVITCDATHGCPPGYQCQQAVGRCINIDEQDKRSPTIVSSAFTPAVARRGATLKITLTASEPLGQPPTVTLTERGRVVTLSPDSTDAETSLFSHLIGADDVEGVASLSAELLDAVGNQAPGLVIGAPVFDFTPPALRSVTFVAPRTLVDAGVLAVRPDEAVSVRISLSEPVQDATLQATSSCGGVSFGTASGNLLDFTARRPGVDGCSYQLVLDETADEAGNVLGRLPLEVAYRVDALAPAITDVQLGRPADGGLTPATTFSRSPGFNVVALGFTVRGDAARLTARVDDVELPSCQLQDCVALTADTRRCTCTYPLDAGDVEGTHVLSVVAQDEAGNSKVAGVPAQFDFTPPSVPSIGVVLVEPGGCPLSNVQAVGRNTQVKLSFTTSEPLLDDPVLTVSPARFGLTKNAGGTSSQFTFSGRLTADGGVDGPQRFDLELRDQVGNAARLNPSGGLLVDTQAPAPPNVGPTGLVYRRVPWRNTFSLSADAGVIEANANLLIWDATSQLLATKLVLPGAAVAINLPGPDREAIKAETFDSACNGSGRVSVSEIEWVASLDGKRNGSSTENPHQYSFSSVFVRDRGVLNTFYPVPFASTPNAVLSARGQRDWQLCASNFTPLGRSAPGSAYDALRHRVVLYGGVTVNGFTNDTLEWQGASVIDRTPAGSTAPQVMGVALAYDSTRDKLVAFGGSGFQGLAGETWEFDGENWARRAQATTQTPPLRTNAALAYDAARGVTVLFGGDALGVQLDDTWEWNGATWTQNTAATHPARGATPRFAFDGASLVLVTMNPLPETWRYDGSWSKLSPMANLPAIARVGFGLTFDENLQGVLLFGGLTTGNNPQNELWLYKNQTWALVPVMGPAPTPRSGVSFAFDAARRVAVTAGGVGPDLDLWEFDGTRWQSALGPSPRAHLGEDLSYSPARGAALLTGGYEVSGGRWLDEVWQWAGGRWSPLAKPPLLRADGGANPGPWAATYEPTADRLVVVGPGMNGGTQTYTLPLDAGAWQPLATTTTVSNAAQLRFAGDGGVLAWVGPALHRFNGNDWAQVSDAGPAVVGAAVAFDGTELLVHAGLANGLVSRLLLAWNGGSWRQLSSTGPSARRNGVLACNPTNRECLSFGGSNGSALFDTWVYDGGWRSEAPLQTPGGLTALTFDANRGTYVGLGRETWEYALDPEATPSHLAHFNLDAPGAVGTVRSMTVTWTVAAQSTLDGGAVTGAQLWVEDLNALLPQTTHTAGTLPSSGATLSWSTSDVTLLARLMAQAPHYFSTAVTPLGTNGTTGARIDVSDVQFVLRYRMP